MNTRTIQNRIHVATTRLAEGLAETLGGLRSVLFSGPCRLPMRAPIPVPVPGRRPNGLTAMRVVAPALAGVLALALLTSAAEARHGDFVANGDAVDVQLRVEGQTAPLFVKRGDWSRWYFEAFHGRNYSLVLRNTTGRRLGVLIAVDGLNVVNGERSRLRHNEAMYVLEPWGRAEIKGWRTSMNSIRKFVFVDEERSYAERTGQANGDMGWIRVLAFKENKPWVQYRDDRPALPYEGRGDAPEFEGRERSHMDDAAPRSAKPNTLEGNKQRADSFHGAPESAPGTGWGSKGWDPVTRTHFTPHPRPVDQLAFRYEYESGLRALGIFPNRWRDRVWERDRGQLGFAKPPRW